MTQSSELGEAKATKICSVQERRELHKEHELQQWRFLTSLHVGENHQGKEENHQEGVSETISTGHTGPGIIHILGNQTEKTS